MPRLFFGDYWGHAGAHMTKEENQLHRIRAVEDYFKKNPENYDLAKIALKGTPALLLAIFSSSLVMGAIALGAALYLSETNPDITRDLINEIVAATIIDIEAGTASYAYTYNR